MSERLRPGRRLPRTALVSTALAVVGVLALAVVIAVGVTHLGFLREGHRSPFVAWTLIAWTVFAGSVLALRFVPPHLVTRVVLGGAVVVGIAALVGPPNTSTDSARYAWDGIVQHAGVSPYAHTPQSEALAGLRPDWLFPDKVDGTCKPLEPRYRGLGDGALGHCTALNRPDVPTIYPPMAELWFALVRVFVPVTAQYMPFQVAGLLVSLGVTVGLLVVLRRIGRPTWWAALWAWSPLVAAEAVTNSHVDVVGAALATAGAVLVAFGRPIWGGIALGAATATKLIPAIVYPALLGRWRSWWAIPVGIAVFGLLYVPYVLSTGPKVLGYLPGYLSEEGYEDGSRFALVAEVLPGDAATIAVGLIVLVAAVIAWRLSDPANPWSGQVFMIGVTFLAVTPRYPWYALLLIPFVVLSGRWEWLSLTLAIALRGVWPSVVAYRWWLLAAIAVVLVVTLVRTRREDWLRWRDRLLGRSPATRTAAALDQRHGPRDVS
ncbi:glycosyltransferase family 87 protein [Curtobacterium sp. MCSS17_015]|uniref:glycosyltransferase family 87 protein n=1 Tax=Curtobacterium sp. MCSS17_015 TaxID=2175666 RepID=UPI000DA7AA2F|nr:glycosyltransferase family 87 protein [Curtobacterium sp. MCSS17_015]WIB25873.1 glycosyltransferase family 87 protein [Curtobacterium sp. MCSS17_015]